MHRNTLDLKIKTVKVASLNILNNKHDESSKGEKVEYRIFHSMDAKVYPNTYL